MPAGRPLRIVQLASEVAPFAKTGGLADAVSGLSKALARAGHEVHVVLPLYGSIERARFQLQPTGLRLATGLPEHPEQMEVFAAPPRPGLPRFWFLSHPLFARLGLYGEKGEEYADNHVRFTGFARAALALVRQTVPSPDILHLHDWQSAPAAVLLRASEMQPDPSFARTRVVFTIHNLAYTGAFAPEGLEAAGLPAHTYSPDALEFYGRATFLKAGIVLSDALTTVSPRYSREIQIPEFGGGFDALLRERSSKLYGILNGIDANEWNPAADPVIPARYDARELRGKAECKAALQRELGLAEEPRSPLFAVVSRLAWQKGIDLVAELAESIVGRGGQLAILGQGEPGLEGWLGEVSKRLPAQIAVRIGFDEALSHRIIAGADVFLMPSRVEPCGLTQMYALRYGTVPVVRAVGGLDDTIEEIDSVRELGTGFKFGATTASAFWAAIQRAFHAYSQPAVWHGLRLRGMAKDHSWDRAGAEYVQLFENLARA